MLTSENESSLVKELAIVVDASDMQTEPEGDGVLDGSLLPSPLLQVRPRAYFDELCCAPAVESDSHSVEKIMGMATVCQVATCIADWALEEGAVGVKGLARDDNGVRACIFETNERYWL